MAAGAVNLRRFGDTRRKSDIDHPTRIPTYDEDGDGIFETRLSDKLGALFLPKWVK
jgi:hypothetical protein